MIRFTTIDKELPSLDYAIIRNWLTDAIEEHGYRVGELYYQFCSDETLLEINRTRLGHDFYTDIVTFPLDGCEEFISSEFCISLDRIAENAITFGRTYESELCRVILHGVLHLIGFDDLTDEDEKRMRSGEEHYLSNLCKYLNINKL